MLPTYTAMLALRGIVAGRGLVADFWERDGVKIRVGHLYPEYLNIYADRGNIAVLGGPRRGARARARAGSRSGSAIRFPPGSTSSTSAAARIASRSSSRRTSPRRRARFAQAAEDGAVFLAVCGGYQLLGRSYRDTLRRGASRRRASCRSTRSPASGG